MPHFDILGVNFRLDGRCQASGLGQTVELGLQNGQVCGGVAANQRGEIYLLFDRLDDPGETINLAGSSDPDIVSLETDLRQRILERLLQSQIRDDLNRAPE